MNFIFAVALPILVLGIEIRALRDGYPLASNGCKFGCSELGENNPTCNYVCDKHAGSDYGYCYGWTCYCEHVAEGTILWGDPGTGPCMV
ncbi:alpha-toxin Cn12 [Centruroides vittatus]|uniref:alpha-toxin Cn12 n=1 Tax=Centruroides vittatus TaxID=120091 RepID=UPI0035107B27